jgi:hypothetical protein
VMGQRGSARPAAAHARGTGPVIRRHPVPCAVIGEAREAAPAYRWVRLGVRLARGPAAAPLHLPRRSSRAAAEASCAAARPAAREATCPAPAHLLHTAQQEGVRA